MIKNIIDKFRKKADTNPLNNPNIVSKNNYPIFFGLAHAKKLKQFFMILTLYKRKLFFKTVFKYEDKPSTVDCYEKEAPKTEDEYKDVIRSAKLMINDLKVTYPDVKIKTYDFTKYKTIKEKLDAFSKLNCLSTSYKLDIGK